MAATAAEGFNAALVGLWRLGARLSFVTLVSVLASVSGSGPAGAADADTPPAMDSFYELMNPAADVRRVALKRIAEHWEQSYTPMILELFSLSRDPVYASELLAVLRENSGEDHGYDIEAWYHWLWQKEPEFHPQYADFKSRLYGLLDTRFSSYFSSRYQSEVRLDEVRWGGVKQNGIPPLREPKMLAAAEADYLGDGDVIFGIEVKGEARAYPKRILAWHELFTDEIAGVPVAGVYCTLCGAMVVYRSESAGVRYDLGTSGFLYRSNKLMFDAATNSLWNTLWGRPVIGPLVGRGVQLERMPVVTTTWSDWNRRHPDTTVLSLDTGYSRDYAEGAAYRNYFSHDRPMFSVPRLDDRLRNKQEILGLVFPAQTEEALAISLDFLDSHPLYSGSLGGVDFVVLSDRAGGRRVFSRSKTEFTEWDRDRSLRDDHGVVWTSSEEELRSADGRSLKRLPAHRAFWFGWQAAWPRTRLIR